MIVKYNINCKDKYEVLSSIASIARENNNVRDEKLYLEGLIKREEQFTTGFGNSVAIPHCKGEFVEESCIIVMKLENKIDWNSLDNKAVNIIIAFAVAEEDMSNKYLVDISKIAKHLMDVEFIKQIQECNTKDELEKSLLSIIQ